MDICLISEDLSLPFDEGIKNFAYNLIKELRKRNNVYAISTGGYRTDERYVEKLKINKTFLSYSLFKRLRSFKPEIILYIPSPSATLFSFSRIRMLKLYNKKSKVVMVALQPRSHSFLAQKLIPHLIPDLVIVQSQNFLKRLSKYGCQVKFITGGVDLEKFHAVTNESKIKLRQKYGIHQNKFVILHIGHIKKNRNIELLKELQIDNHQVIVVGSTSTSQDGHLVSNLRMAGIRVILDYFDNIEEIYQLSDCYIFPVTENNASIEFPLSVLEAMACNIPVISTRFGGLVYLLKEGKGLFWADTLKEVKEKIEQVKLLKNVETRSIAEQFSWKSVAKKIIEQIK
ncbi:hypothetical protein BXT86_01155 [candidate division WOR-3 bacterium 4484_100]|uniref:Glycosyl transferase family 1 domain-containing protein n=1 Tax=candidate division WOR-3 bacterium 4484_100 TaxID=1936077 RepID=A0A1V4QHU7_UNCW3|nr:MAG: hypothetical protein BXT86_01155 [candidate division WOR-3 bacterium 4484_100]